MCILVVVQNPARISPDAMPGTRLPRKSEASVYVSVRWRLPLLLLLLLLATGGTGDGMAGVSYSTNDNSQRLKGPEDLGVALR